MTRFTNVLMAVIAFALMGLLFRTLSPAVAQGVAAPSVAAAPSQTGKFQMVVVGGNVELLNTQTGEVWTEFVGTNGGQAQWAYDTPSELRQKPVPPHP